MQMSGMKNVKSEYPAASRPAFITSYSYVQAPTINFSIAWESDSFFEA
jgi:hypothetical protein